MKKIVAALLAVVLSFAMLGLLSACGASASSIDRITTQSQESNGVKYINYYVHFKENVDWASLSQSDREKLAKVGFDEAQKKIAEDEVFNYNISGTTAEGVDAFRFNGAEQTLRIMVDGETVGEIPVEVPQN
jgi:ABC-type oligopeptide transport system substrate-binding subunit